MPAQHAGGDRDDHRQWVDRDPSPEEERLQTVRLELLDEDDAAEHEQRGHRALVDERDEDRHAAGQGRADERHEGA